MLALDPISAKRRKNKNLSHSQAFLARIKKQANAIFAQHCDFNRFGQNALNNTLPPREDFPRGIVLQ
ncbi:MAG: hypothetical protein IJW87_04735 [Clostridia bacterium]|nr:hypothetical protein [Clostridia bacterium]